MSKLFPQTIDEYAEEFRSASRRADRLPPDEIIDSLLIGSIKGIHQFENDPSRAMARIGVVIAAHRLVRAQLKGETRP